MMMPQQSTLAQVARPVRAAATALEWEGIVLPSIRLLGGNVYPVVRVDQRAHEYRRAHGQGPMLDLAVLEMWEWPESFGARAPEVVALRGVIGYGKRWSNSLRDASRMRGFCADAIVADTSGPRCYEACAQARTALVDGTNLAVLLAPRAGRSEGARRTVMDRWLEEWLYSRLLELGHLD